MGISDALLNLTGSFLESRLQRVILNGQTSEWSTVKTGVPQGFILGPLFILITYQLVPYPLLNCLQMIHHYSPLFMMLRQQHIN